MKIGLIPPKILNKTTESDLKRNILYAKKITFWNYFGKWKKKGSSTTPEIVENTLGWKISLYYLTNISYPGGTRLSIFHSKNKIEIKIPNIVEEIFENYIHKAQEKYNNYQKMKQRHQYHTRN